MSENFYSQARMRQAKIPAILVGLIAALPLHALADTLRCPPEVMAASVNVAGVPAPWTVHDQPNKLKVVSVGFSDGPPSDRANLKPDETHRKGHLTVAKWKFEGTYPKGKWLSCVYEGGLFSLAQELPPGVLACAVTYEKTKNGSTQPGAVTCQ